VDGVAAGAIIITTSATASASALSVGGDGDDGCYVTQRVPTPFGYRLRTINVCEY
jgi:hypothetical protein